MLVKILGGIDLLVGFLLIFSSGLESISPILMFFGIVLIIKSFMGFFQEFGGYIDLIGGLFLLLASFGFSITIINVILGFLVLQKGVFSFL